MIIAAESVAFGAQRPILGPFCPLYQEKIKYLEKNFYMECYAKKFEDRLKNGPVKLNCLKIS